MKKLFLICFVLFCSKAFCEQALEKVFTEIYEKGVWGKNKDGEGCSGGGSSYDDAVSYIKFLESFIKEKEINSVLDFGCGDWAFSKYINWGEIKYIGIDVVKKVIESNQKKFASANISFLFKDGIEGGLPSADLLICKDVLQHLSNEDILLFLKEAKKFRHCLITNDIDLHNLKNNNKKISVGDWRPLDLTLEPFNLKIEKIFIYRSTMGRFKQVFYLHNE